MHAAILANSQFHGIGNGFASGVVHDSENVRHGQARRFLPGPAGHPLGNGIKKSEHSGDVGADYGVADAFERNLGAFLFHEQRLFHHLALDGIAQGAQQPARLDLPFDEIILRALLQGLRGQRLVVEAGQHHQRHAGGRCVSPANGL